MNGWEGDGAVHVLQPSGHLELGLNRSEGFDVAPREAQFRFREFFRNFHQVWPLRDNSCILLVLILHALLLFLM